MGLDVISLSNCCQKSFRFLLKGGGLGNWSNENQKCPPS